MNNIRVIKTYVWHGEKCFFVSTIERDSSAMVEPPPQRFNETIVWEYDWDKNERGVIIHQDEDCCGSIRQHQKICDYLYKHGKIWQEGEDA